MAAKFIKENTKLLRFQKQQKYSLSIYILLSLEHLL